MPKPKYFNSGKYGKVNPWTQATLTLEMNRMLGMKEMSPKTFNNLKNIIDKIGPNVKNQENRFKSLADNTLEGGTNSSDTSALYNAILESNKYYKSILNKREPKMLPFLGYARLIETVSNPEKGNFTEAVYDNLYMEQFISQGIKLYSVNSEGKNGQKQTVEYLASQEGLGQALPVFDAYFETIGNLINSEYEKKALLDDYSQEKEQSYLSNLSANIQKMIETYEQMSGFVNADGKSPYDHCFSDPLATVVGKGDILDGSNRRNIISSIENLQGQKKAIENGWGAGELEVLGSMNQILGVIQRDIQLAEAEYNKKSLNSDDEIQALRERLSEEQTKLNELLDKGVPVEKEEEKNDEKKHDRFIRKLDEYNADKERYQKNIQKITLQIENYPQELEKARKHIEELKEAQNEMTSIKEEAWDKKEPSTADKFMMTRKFRGFLDKYSKDNSPIKGYCPIYRKAVDKAAQYGFVKPVKDTEFEKNLFQKDDYEKYNQRFVANKYFLKPIMMASEHYEDFQTVNNDIFELVDKSEVQISRDNELFAPLCFGKDPHYNLVILTDNNKELEEKNKILSKWAQETIAKSNSAIKSFNSYTKILAAPGDIDRADVIEFYGDNAFIDPLMSNVSGAGPEIFRSIVDKSGITPEQVREYFQTTGVKRPLMRFFDGAAEYLDALTFKQRGMKDNWTALKETRYLARLEHSFDKIISEYDQLEKFPDNLQQDKLSKMYGNSLGHMTSKGTPDEKRGVTKYIEGLRWMKQGIHNGWGSRDLEALNLMGIFEGTLNMKKYNAQFTGDMDTLVKYNDWEEKHFKPVKELLSNMKIRSSSDVLEAISIIEDFQKKASNDDLVKDISKVSLDIIDRGFLKRVTNACIEDIKTGKSLYYGDNISKEDIFKKSDFSDDMKTTAESIRTNKDLSENELKSRITQYIKNYYMNDKNIHSNPELFMRQNTYYSVVERRLNKECEKYSDELIKSLKNNEGKLPSNDVIADILEFGDHEPHMSDIKDRIETSMALSRIKGFANGRHENKENDKTLSEALDIMEKADVGVFTTNTRFSDVMDNLKLLDKQRARFKDQISVKFFEGSSINVDEKEMQNYINMQKETYKIINSYLSDKNRKIRKKKGNPERDEDIALLGVNGAKRYRAMLEAKNTLENLYKTTKDFQRNGFTDTQRITWNHKDDPFKIDGENMKQDMLREKYRLLDNKAREVILNEEKYRIKEAETYQRIKKQREVDLADNRITQEQYQNFQKEDKAEYNNKILSSAKKTLFVESVRNVYTDRANKNYYNKASYDDTMPKIKEYETAIREISLENNKGISFNENSDQFKKYKDLMFKEGNTFGKNFEEAILSSDKVPIHSDIIKIRDNSLQKSIEGAVTDNEKKKYQGFVSVIGKGETEESYGTFKKQKDAEKAELEKNNQNNMKKDNVQQKLLG